MAPPTSPNTDLVLLTLSLHSQTLVARVEIPLKTLTMIIIDNHMVLCIKLLVILRIAPRTINAWTLTPQTLKTFEKCQFW
jgi:hypothetical protein